PPSPLFPYTTLFRSDPAGAHSRLNLAQALNSLGTTVFPFVLGPLILSAAVLGADQLAAMTPAELSAYRGVQAQSVQLPYLWLAAGMIALAVFVGAMRIPTLREADGHPQGVRPGFREALRH